jgi:hypothetical protein
MSEQDDVASAVARQIMESAGVSTEAPLTEEQLQELEDRRNRFREYCDRQAEERHREDEAQRIAAQRQTEEAERRRKAEAKEALRQSTLEHARRVSAFAKEQERDAQIAQQQHEWAVFKDQLAQAQAEQQRQQFWDNMSRLTDEMDAIINPKPQPEAEVVYVSESDDPWNDFHFGATDLRKHRF